MQARERHLRRKKAASGVAVTPEDVAYEYDAEVDKVRQNVFATGNSLEVSVVAHDVTSQSSLSVDYPNNAKRLTLALFSEQPCEKKGQFVACLFYLQSFKEFIVSKENLQRSYNTTIDTFAFDGKYDT